MRINKNLTLESFALIAMIIASIIMSLIQSDIFNLSKSVQLIIASIITIFSIGILVAMSISDSISILLLSNFLLFYVSFGASTIIKAEFFQFDAIPLKIYLIFFIFILIVYFINTSIITAKLNNISKPTLTHITNKKMKNSVFLTYLKKFDNLINSILYKIRILFPIMAYILAILTIILNFAIIYESNNSYAIENILEEGLFYNYMDDNNKRVRAMDLEPLYFSTCTFLNTNDGNIIPVGDPIKMLVQLEMILAHVMNIIFIPTLLFFYFKIFENKSKTCKNKSKKCIYNVAIDQDSFNTSNRRNSRIRKMRKSRNC